MPDVGLTSREQGLEALLTGNDPSAVMDAIPGLTPSGALTGEGRAVPQCAGGDRGDQLRHGVRFRHGVQAQALQRRRPEGFAIAITIPPSHFVSAQ
jgi:hypothetical protein